MSETRSFLETTPVRYPAFAEWVSNATETTSQHGEFAPKSAPGIRDTGTVVRAFLPFEEDNERRHLIEYHGYATAVDMRVVCMRPKLTNVLFSSADGYRVTGLVDTEREPLGLLRPPDNTGNANYSMSFNCGFSAGAWQGNSTNQTAWSLALCGLRSDLKNLHQGMEEPVKRPPEDKLY
jgi:hypothetical protein